MNNSKQIVINGIVIKEGDYIRAGSDIFKITHIHSPNTRVIGVKRLVDLKHTTFWYYETITVEALKECCISKIPKLRQLTMGLDDIKDFHEVWIKPWKEWRKKGNQ